MHLHFDCFSGISGDMILGALLDAGLSPTRLRQGLRALPLNNYQLQAKRVHRGAVRTTKVTVTVKPSERKPLSWTQIKHLIKQSVLPPWVKKNAQIVFSRLAEAESRVHGGKVSRIHFHEVGVVDSLVDVVGGLLGCHLLGIQTFSATPVNVGSGSIQTDHGILPVPAPAVAELAKGIPIYAKGPELELTTPTGMAVLTTLTRDFTSLPLSPTHTIGYGAGTANPHGWINALRVFISGPKPAASVESDRVIQLTTNIDDMNPQLYEVVLDRLFENGALDVTLSPATMKHGRPGMILTVLVKPEYAENVVRMLFRETTTIGLRTQMVDRLILPRHHTTVQLADGKVRVKMMKVGEDTKRVPEFQDCYALAKKSGKPVREIMEEVLRKLPR